MSTSGGGAGADNFTALTGRTLSGGAAHVAALALILAAALALRLVGLDWDQGQHLHPDERFLSTVLTQIRPASGLAEYFDPAASPLNPFNHGVTFFVYGTFPLFLVESLARLLGFEGYDRAYLLGRALSALADTGTVLIVYLIARRLLGSGAALLAATLLAFAVHSIQISHFFAVDTFATFFATTGLFFFLRYAAGRGARDLGFFGVAAGLAVASKLSAALLLLLYVGWWLVQAWREGHVRGGWRPLAGWCAHALAVGVLVAVVFRLFQPYAFQSGSPLDWRPGEAFLSAVAQQKSIQEGTYDWPPGVQWAGTAPYLYPLEQIVRWGAGPAFGLLALAGTAAAAIVSWRRRHPLALVLIWGALNFAYFGALVLKTGRYFHPLYPVLALAAAWLIAAAWRRAGQPGRLPRPLGRTAVATLAALVVGATAVWAVAFTQIYTRDHTRVTASEWIYDNVPRGATIATEHWDDALPLTLPGRARGDYEFLQLRVFDRDDASKRAHLATTLGSADVIVVSSDRGLGSIPRMPQRYPLTGRYYQALLAGELGFERIGDFTSNPGLGPWQIVDREAEEAFTVYDHPQVLIFGRSDLNPSPRIHAVLDSVDERAAVAVEPHSANSRSFELPADRVSEVKESFSWPAVFAERPLSGTAAAVAWYLAALAAGLAIWPLIWRALPWLPDAAYTPARVLGPMAVSLPAWWLASAGLAPFDAASITGGLGLLAAVGAAVGWRHRARLRRAVARRWPYVALAEGVLLLAYVGFAALRARNPDLWHPVFGGEKPMDFAHLNAVLRSTTFPPYDPWYAGGQLNYYYLGHVPTAALAKVLGVVPAVAYNLALAGYFAMAAAAVFSVGVGVWAMLRRPGRMAVLVGLLAVLLVLVAGNLHTAGQVARIAQRHAADPSSPLEVAAQIPTTIAGGDLVRDYDFWAPTRVIPATVNEFPWFTFIHGDLHPHLMNFGFTALALIGAAALLALGERTRASGVLRVRPWLGVLLFQALVLGIHHATNPWDFPTYLVITVGVFAYALWRTGRVSGRALMARTSAAALGLIVVSQLLFWPFHQTYVDFFGGVAPPPETTPAFMWLVIFGAPATVLVTLIWTVLATPRTGRQAGRNLERENAGAHGPRFAAEQTPATSSRWLGLAAAAAAGLAALGLILGAEQWSGRVLLAGVTALAVLALWRVRDRPLLCVPLACLAAGAALTAIPEFVVVRDDIGRLNTVFKTYFQAWMLLGVGAGIAIPLAVGRLWARTQGGMRWVRAVWLTAIAVLAWIVFAYPFAATPHKLDLRIQNLPPTLDGEAFMDGGTISDLGRPVSLSSDLAAIRWLRSNVQGAPTIVEGPTTIYRWGGRISVYTGLPAVVGWDWHARQQHWGYVHAVDARLDDVRELFTTTSAVRARHLLDRYDVDLIYVGELERAHFDELQLGKFERMRSLGVAPVYSQGPVTIYQVLEVDRARGEPVG